MLRFISSCDTAVPLSQYFEAANDCAYDSGSGREGTSSIVGTAAPYSAIRATKRVTLGGAGNDMTMGWWLDMAGADFGGGFVAFVFAAMHYAAGGAFDFSSTKQLSLICLPDLSIHVRRGNWNGTTIAETEAGAMSSGVFFMEWRAKISNTEGEVELRMNDEIVLQADGLDTQNLSSSLLDGAEWVPWVIDDLYILDPTGPKHTTFLGSRFHCVANPMSAVSAAGFAPGTVARILATDSSNNVAASASTDDLFTPTALDASVSRILAVQGCMVGLRDTAGPTLADAVNTGSGVSYGTAHTLGGSSDAYFEMRESQPGGSEDWTRAIYNASTRGYSRRA